MNDLAEAHEVADFRVEDFAESVVSWVQSFLGWKSERIGRFVAGLVSEDVGSRVSWCSAIRGYIFSGSQRKRTIFIFFIFLLKISCCQPRSVRLHLVAVEADRGPL